MTEYQNNEQVLASENTLPTKALNIVSRGKAWRRFIAKIFDLYLVSFLVMPILFVIFSVNPATIPTPIYGCLVLIVWTLIEPILLATVGTTLGKLLLGIKISDENNKKLSIGAAIKRSFSVWFFGFGLGIALVSIFTFVGSYSDLTKRGVTRWDRKGNIHVSYEPLSTLKIAIFFTILIAMFASAFLLA